MKLAFVYNQQRENLMEQGEFDTLETIETISSALASTGDTVIPIEMTTDGSWIQALRRAMPDLVFNTAEGFFGIGRESLLRSCLNN